MKKWYASKTLWTNLLMGATALFAPDAVFGGADPASVTALLGIANIGLRFATDKKLVK